MRWAEQATLLLFYYCYSAYFTTDTRLLPLPGDAVRLAEQATLLYLHQQPLARVRLPLPALLLAFWRLPRYQCMRPYATSV